MDRISRIKDFRKLHADTQVQTTHLLKKCVMVPINHDAEDPEERLPTTTAQPFQRGVMTFDDYNYNMTNQYILIEEPQDKAAA
jgi:hypothetical protein